MNKSYYSDVFQLMDDIFSDAFSLIERNQPARFNKAITSAQFPPNNVLIDQKTKELTFEVALAGVKENEINLSFDGEYLRLVVDRDTGDKDLKENERVTQYVAQRGLKLVDHAEVSWIVDPRYYDRDSAKVTFENGLLTVVISPRSEVAPKKINLFGKLADKQIEEKTE